MAGADVLKSRNLLLRAFYGQHNRARWEPKSGEQGATSRGELTASIGAPLSTHIEDDGHRGSAIALSSDRH